MIGEELAPGLRRWVVHHREWKQDVGCVLVERDGVLCLIDPLLPSRRVAFPKRSQLHVLISVYWHTRDAGDVLRSHRGTLWAPSGARAAVARRAEIEPRTFRPGDELPAGIEALPTSRGSEVVFWLPWLRALVPGDVLLGADGGGLRLCPASWVGGDEKLEQLRARLQPLRDLPVGMVLVSHGEPVLRNARRALARALDS